MAKGNQKCYEAQKESNSTKLLALKKICNLASQKHEKGALKGEKKMIKTYAIIRNKLHINFGA